MRALYRMPGSNPGQHQLSHTLTITLSTVGAEFGAASAYSSTQNTLSDFRCRLLDFFGFCFGLCLDLIAMDFRPPSTSASASTASTSSSASSPALDSAARRSCTKCSRRMSSYAHNKHSLCLHCRDVLCSVNTRCRECSTWSTDEMLEYVKHRKSLVSKGKKRSSVATPTSASPSVSPSVTPVKVSVSASKVASPVSSLPSLASKEVLKMFVHSVLA